jgi:hypothetical protein
MRSKVHRASALAATFVVLGLAAPIAHADELSLRMQSEVSGYKDTNAVAVATPGLAASVENVTDGWGFGGSFLVDVVSAASADIVATASPYWIDVRYVPGANAHFGVGEADVRVAGGASVESDYVAGTGSIGVSMDFADKTITPAFSYSFGYDVAGRRGTPYDVYALTLQRHGLNASTTFVVNKSTILVPTLSAVFEIGDQEKPYRYLPTFLPGTVVDTSLSNDEIHRLRTSVRLGEEVPELRQRYAGSALFAHRFGAATMRLDERLYIDSWGLMATTTDFTLPIDLDDRLRVWPHARVHAQKGVSFWQSAYEVQITPQGVVAPQLRAGDRELGPMVAGTLGAGARLGLGNFGLTAQLDAIYTRYLDHLFIQQNLAGFALVGVDVEVD